MSMPADEGSSGFAGTGSAYRVVEGRIQAPVLELDVVENCNLSCQSCSHLSPVLRKHHVDVATVERDLTLLSRHYHAVSLKLVGGEPLLHPDLIAIAGAIRRSGVADVIYLVTNGVLLPRMGLDFWRAIDWIEVSLYPGKSLSEAQRAFCWSKAGAANTGLLFRERSHFRNSYSEVGTSDAGLARAIYRTCAVAHEWKCHTVADGRFFKCPQSYFLPKVLPSRAGDAETDSLLIEDSEEFGERLLSYLQSPEPLQSCGHCLGTAGREFPHSQVKRADFRSLQQRPTEELIDAPLLRRAGWEPRDTAGAVLTAAGPAARRSTQPAR
jgi:hypothetical protein